MVPLGENAWQWVQHATAHRSRRVIAELEAEDKRIALGNEAADHLAKEGADEAQGFGRDQALREEGAKVKWAFANLGWWHQHFATDGWPDASPRPPQPRADAE